ncbi:MAG: zinc ribbon domain-containing protein [Epulopiscium sp.]|nr:zinc ribbon domain-containing protein [Candidatus Epulonipiscium sp.]
MDTIKDHKCPSCGAGLEFNPITQNWKCSYCLTEFNKGELNTTLPKEETLNEDMEELDSYRCPSCGAELIADSTTSATFCLYCRNHNIIKSRISGKFKPKSVLPFRLTKEQAADIYKKWIKKRILAPKEFKKKEEIEKITGIYAPFWLFDCKTHGMIEGEGTRVSSWSDGKYRYTQTKYYRVVREGRAGYSRVPVDGSKKLDDKFMHLIEPYNYGGLLDFSMKYMSGFMAEKYDVDSPEAELTMKKRVERYFEDRLRGTVNGYSSFTVQNKSVSISNTSHEYAMLPIYLLNNRYKDKDHMFIINGQTGKVVGETPVSLLGQIGFAGAVFILTLIITIFGGALFV